MSEKHFQSAIMFYICILKEIEAIQQYFRFLQLGPYSKAILKDQIAEGDREGPGDTTQY